jgi:hypothetical protein
MYNALDLRLVPCKYELILAAERKAQWTPQLNCQKVWSEVLCSSGMLCMILNKNDKFVTGTPQVQEYVQPMVPPLHLYVIMQYFLGQNSMYKFWSYSNFVMFGHYKKNFHIYNIIWISYDGPNNIDLMLYYLIFFTWLISIFRIIFLPRDCSNDNL